MPWSWRFSGCGWACQRPSRPKKGSNCTLAALRLFDFGGKAGKSNVATNGAPAFAKLSIPAGSVGGTNEEDGEAAGPVTELRPADEPPPADEGGSPVNELPAEEIADEPLISPVDDPLAEDGGEEPLSELAPEFEPRRLVRLPEFGSAVGVKVVRLVGFTVT